MGNSTLPTQRTRNADLQFWLRWVIASTAATLLGFGVVYGLIFIVKAISPSINEDRLGGGTVFPIMAMLLRVSQ